MSRTIEEIVRRMTTNPEHIIALLEYSFGNKFDYMVNIYVENGDTLDLARERILSHYLRELETKRVRT